MILCDRGTYYCSPPQIIEKAATGMMAKYRGVAYTANQDCAIEEGHRLVGQANRSYRFVKF
jgi:Domain of unknown function (DUF4278)